jgi:hypothetical protein
MVMTEDHKKKIAAGVKAYHGCAKSKGCGKQKTTTTTAPKKPKPPPNKPKKERPQPPARILALEDIKEKTNKQSNKKEKKKFKVNRAKRGEVNRNLESQYKKPAHKILGVSYNASPEEIKKAFRPFLKFHPDKRSTGDLEKYQKYSSAYSGMLNSIDIIG